MNAAGTHRKVLVRNALDKAYQRGIIKPFGSVGNDLR
jgi:hypothetical protein